MKETKQMQELEEMLRSSRLVIGGFLGGDHRPLTEIIETDLATLEHLGFNKHQLADKMRELTELASPRLGLWVEVDDSLKVSSVDYKGQIICPWPHAGNFDKRVTTALCKKTHEQVSWTDLNIHMIEEHGFFEGRGSAFRIDPTKIVSLLLDY